ncbi:MAG: hydroxymethylglutaryl-CoA reductase [Candidatus Thorarchaeota archaeon]|nr:MAG: hydroxymethylglutaryl-CoA reductase [Candidatus Thorarchaeota archaeon]
MQIPAFLLRKLYVKGSLENVDGGFQFRIKNSLAPATSIAMDPLKVNDEEYPHDAVIVKSDEGEVKASEISESNSFAIKVGVEITVFVAGDSLPEGEYKLDIGFTTKEAGKLAFDVTDAL